MSIDEREQRVKKITRSKDKIVINPEIKELVEASNNLISAIPYTETLYLEVQIKRLEDALEAVKL